MIPPCVPLKEIIDALAKVGEVRPHWNENNELECISFATREQIDLFQRFPEVIGIDSTYNTNRSRYLSLERSVHKYSLQLSTFQVIVTDGCGHGRPVMYCLSSH